MGTSELAPGHQSGWCHTCTMAGTTVIVIIHNLVLWCDRIALMSRNTGCEVSHCNGCPTPSERMLLERQCAAHQIERSSMACNGLRTASSWPTWRPATLAQPEQKHPKDTGQLSASNDESKRADHRGARVPETSAEAAAAGENAPITQHHSDAVVRARSAHWRC